MTCVSHDLALFGGRPVYSGGWDAWPRVRDMASVLRGFEEVLSGRCWTVRVPGAAPCQAEKAERAWAEYCETDFALTVTSGSGALELALSALGVGPGKEVIVPALGWYATAAAVCRVGATPVFADVDFDTSCIDPADVERRVSPRTAAIIAVHLHSALADLDGLSRIATAHDIPLIEDAAQAHGGRYRGRPVGSVGDVGCFSFNQEKQLAIGEGGGVTTRDPELFRLLYELRTDGYRPPRGGNRSFTPSGAVQGRNLCLGELQATLLLKQLEYFEEEHEARLDNARALEAELGRWPAVTPLKTADGTTRRTFYEFGMICEPGAFGDWPAEAVGRALAAEVGANVYQTDVPVQLSPLFAGPPTSAPPPRAAELHERLLVFHHRLLLSPLVAEVVPEAVEKVRDFSSRVPARVLEDWSPA